MARGRRQKPYTPTWGGDPIPGLYKCPDGRWRINATGQKFTEHDERLAISKFRQREAQRNAEKAKFTVTVAEAPSGNGARVAEAVVRTAGGVAIEYAPVVWHDGTSTPVTASGPGPVYIEIEDGVLKFKRESDEAAFWMTVRKRLLADARHAATMTGIPGLEQMIRMDVPSDAIKLVDLIAAYRKENPSTDKSKREAIATFQRLIDHAQAKTLDDLTQAKLLAFRASIEESGTLKSAATRVGYYGRIKTIIKFGLKVGLDQTQVGAAIDRCKVLWTAEALPAVNPQPISRDDYHSLLRAAGDSAWRAWLLLGLNLCLHMEEVCALKWSDFDLARGTFACIRNKTRRQRVPRAATLWAETLAVLDGIARRGEFVFVSTHGTRFNKNTRINDFKEFREIAGVSATWDSLRDGAYSAACRATVDDKWARLLAGHSAPGLQDNYVLRHPEAVRPACEAVYKAYGPFPAHSSPAPAPANP